jgi:porphyrinogen peroxidase
MAVPQPGIFALGTSSHAYLQFDLVPGADPHQLTTAVADLSEPRTTLGGVNLVSAFRPELWAGVAPQAGPADVRSFTEPVVGPDGFTMPATQHDLALWIAGPSYDVVFDTTLEVVAALAAHATLVDETVGWAYHHDRDLTGFVDGTENPPLGEAARLVVVPDGQPGAGGSVLLLQKWVHDAAAWLTLPTAGQEQAMGRTKVGSIELDDRPATSHVARTDQDTFGDIFRRNTPYGTATEHGTMFVGFAATQGPLAAMLASMAGIDGPRDDLTRYTTPLTGAYYIAPSLDDLGAFSTPTD